MVGTASGRISVGHSRWMRAGPPSLVLRDRPEVAALRPASPGIKHRRLGLVHKQPRRHQEFGSDVLPKWLQFTRCIARPMCERRPVQRDPLTGKGLCLPVERNVVGIFVDDHLRHQPLSRKATLDQPGPGRCLHHRPLTGSAGVFGAARNDHPVLCRHDVEPPGDVFANPVQCARAAGASPLFRLQNDLDLWKVIRK